MKKLMFLLALFATSQSFAEQNDDEWGDDWEEEPAYEISHELSYGYAAFINNHPSNIENEVVNELRTLSSFNYQGDHYTFNFDVELFADLLLDDYAASIDQLNILLPFSNGVDVKLGRQVITWGTGDMLFLNDLFAKDWKSFFNGRDDGDLKPTIDAVRVSHYGEKFNFEIAYLPEFTPDDTPTGERYSFYLPGFGITQPQPELEAEQPGNSEISARIFANYKGVEWALYAYSGYFKSPSQIDLSGSLGYNRMTSLGASIRMPLYGGLFNAEVVSYDSKDDSNGSNPLVANGQFRLLVGYEKELASELTLASQLYLEKTQNYQSLLDNILAGQEAVEENRTMMTFRLTQLALQQKLVNSLMLFYSPSDKDHYLRYSSSYTVSDNWSIVAGANLLDGKQKNTFLAQMQNNSNVFFRTHYSFN